MPGANDAVQFGDFDYNCVVNAVTTVKSMTVSAGYVATIALAQPLTISGVGGSSYLSLDGAWAVLAGSLPGQPAAFGTLNLNGNSEFVWRAGSLANLIVNVTKTATTSATVNVTGTSTVTKGMSGTVFSVDGLLNWGSSSVHVVNAPGETSIIAVNPTGEFKIGAAGGMWGIANVAPTSGFLIENDGTVRLNAGGEARLVGDYVTTALTRLEVGLLNLAGLAEQTHTSATFDIRDGTTVKATGTAQVLGIRNGLITGHGTVDGKLELGYQDGSPGYVTIRPGVDGGVGTLTVTQSFHIYSYDAYTEIVIDANGGTSKIAVAGQAQLNGYLVVDKHPNFKPPKTMPPKEFMTYNAVAGDFHSYSVLNDGWPDPARPQDTFGRLLGGLPGGGPEGSRHPHPGEALAARGPAGPSGSQAPGVRSRPRGRPVELSRSRGAAAEPRAKLPVGVAVARGAGIGGRTGR